MGLRRLGKRAVLALREPSLGPVFGVKGGGTGGGKATLVPADDINLHFTGDIHAITSAHNLLAALTDNAAHFREPLGDKGALDARSVTWPRAMDMNDRFLRNCVVGLGGKSHGTPRETRFDITAASEVMAVLALAKGPADLQERLGRIVVGVADSGEPVRASDVGAESAMAALLRDALKPNLVQTAEGGAAVVHCGPFANIAHGCNSVLATRLALAAGDIAVTEAGFGFDLGGEKFLDIKCRQAGLWPDLLVLVATLRALKMHGGAAVKDAAQPNGAALDRGFLHLERHLESATRFGLPVVVAINVFPDDPKAELDAVARYVASRRGPGTVRVAVSEGFARGGEGSTELAEAVLVALGSGAARASTAGERPFTYRDDASAEEKITAIATNIYGAKDVAFSSAAKRALDRARQWGHGALPICMAKTHLSLSDDPALVGRPEGFTLTVRDVRISAGAGFLVAVTGDIMTMPGLPRVPAARGVRMRPDGRISGLMQND
jgi:formate--tetrahydrofolate ligase